MGDSEKWGMRETENVGNGECGKRRMGETVKMRLGEQAARITTSLFRGNYTPEDRGEILGVREFNSLTT
jgi:hypothetical protein